jgi:hypothetical protein
MLSLANETETEKGVPSDFEYDESPQALSRNLLLADCRARSGFGE